MMLPNAPEPKGKKADISEIVKKLRTDAAMVSDIAGLLKYYDNFQGPSKELYSVVNDIHSAIRELEGRK